MKTNKQTNKQVKLFLLFLFMLCYFSSFSQSTSGISLGWNGSVGCQTYDELEDGPRKDYIFLEAINSGVCIKVCEKTRKVYTVSGLLTGQTASWSVVGGTIVSSNSNTCTIDWGFEGEAQITLTLTETNGVVTTKTICFEKIKLPTANFTIFDAIETRMLYGCMEQNIYFINQSINENGSSAIVSYLWDFGDGTTSNAFEPVHVYHNSQIYTVTLTVTNACNCSSTIKHEIEIKNRGFDISCPSVVCENSTEVYSLPFDGKELCRDRYNWTVTGGTIVNQAQGDVEVVWNNIGIDGFGYVTFDPKNCNVDCPYPTTIKIPVIQAYGNIDGPSETCVGKQVRYKLPQWPTTDFQWQIAGDPNETAVNIILTDQRNEVILEPLVAGSYTLIATYMNTLLQCGGTAEFTIGVAQPLSIVGDNNVCQNITQNYTTTSSEYTMWTLTNGAGAIVSTAEGYNFEYTFATPGNYTLVAGPPSLSTFCPNTKFTIKVVPTPTFNANETISGDTIVCPDTPITYTLQNTNPNFFYTWSVQNGTPISTNIGSEFTVNFNGSAPANVTVVKNQLADASVCSSVPLVKNVTIKQINAQISNENANICANTVQTYKAFKAATTVLYTTADSYIWKLSNPNVGSINGQGTNSVSITWNNVATVTTVTLTLVIKECTLTKTIQKTITINPTPVISITTPNTTVCPNTAIDFSLNSSIPLTGSYVVNWSVNGLPPVAITGSANYTHYFSNPSTSNLISTISAVVSNVPGCTGTSNTANLPITVLPGPPATATFTGATKFCTASDINTILYVSSSLAGVNIQWFKEGTPTNTPILGATGNSYNVPPTSAGFGNYYFIATNPLTNCATKSNTIYVIDDNCDFELCNISPIPNITNNSSFSCGVINLAATFESGPTPNSTFFNILGPQVFTNLPASTLSQAVILPGVYHTYYTATYNCTNGAPTKVDFGKRVIVPYIPKLSYTAFCNSNNTFNVNLVNQTNYIVGIPITNPDLKYEYKLASSATYQITPGVLNNLPAGTYDFKITVGGWVNGTLQPSCSTSIRVTLAGIPNANITVGSLFCHDSPVKFGLSFASTSGYNYLWTFENDASGNPITNTMANPERVFNTPGPKTITVTVTNALGCSRTFTKTITIPPPCFGGNINSTPPNATACKGSPVILSYDAGSTPNNCTPTYVWMKGNAPAPGATNSPTYSATSPGTYWLQLKNGINGNCKYNCPTVITPIFIPTPSVTLTAPSKVCQGENFTALAFSGASEYKWSLNNVPQPAFDNNANPVFALNTLGANTIGVTVTSNGCSKIVTQNITVNPLPSPLLLTPSLVSCNPYRYILTAKAPAGSTFNWSNGQVAATTTSGGIATNSISITQGGPYEVTATLGGCSVSKQIYVPKSATEYMWIVPSGCFKNCNRDMATLIGPRLPINIWSWLLNNQVLLSEHDTFPDPLLLESQSGSYQFQMNAESCQLTSEPLQYMANECETCNVSSPELINIEQLDYPFCAFTANFTITSNYASNVQVTIASATGNVIVQPASFTLLPGNHTYSFTFIPLENTTGNVSFFISHTNAQGEVCKTKFGVRIPLCSGGIEQAKVSEKTTNSKTENLGKITMYPNPAKEQVTIAYENSNATAIEVYDLMGKLLNQHQVQQQTGNWKLNTSSYPSGVYVVVVKNNNQISSQYKLVIQ